MKNRINQQDRDTFMIGNNRMIKCFLILLFVQLSRTINCNTPTITNVFQCGPDEGNILQELCNADPPLNCTNLMGEPGQDGISVLSGDADPSGECIDATPYINLDSGDTFLCEDASWVLYGNIAGPPGPPGPPSQFTSFIPFSSGTSVFLTIVDDEPGQVAVVAFGSSALTTMTNPGRTIMPSHEWNMAFVPTRSIIIKSLTVSFINRDAIGPVTVSYITIAIYISRGEFNSFSPIVQTVTTELLPIELSPYSIINIEKTNIDFQVDPLARLMLVVYLSRDPGGNINSLEGTISGSLEII